MFIYTLSHSSGKDNSLSVLSCKCCVCLQFIASLKGITELKLDKISMTATFKSGKGVVQKKWLLGKYKNGQELENNVVECLNKI